MTKKPGRPTQTPGQAKTETFTTRCTPAEKQLYIDFKAKLDTKETTK